MINRPSEKFFYDETPFIKSRLKNRYVGSNLPNLDGHFATLVRECPKTVGGHFSWHGDEQVENVGSIVNVMKIVSTCTPNI